MVKYNTFVVYNCKKRHIILVTSSARKAKQDLCVGIKVEVWNENIHIETIYNKQVGKIDKYIKLEKQYIAEKQHKAEIKNNKRRKLR